MKLAARQLVSVDRLGRPGFSDRRPEGQGSANSPPDKPAAGRAVAAAATWLPAPRRRSAAAAIALALLLVAATQRRQLYRHCQDAAARLYYGLDPRFLGRSDDAWGPAPRCCADEACAAGPGARVGVLTYLRGDAYAPLLAQLECTLRRSNPGAELGLMAVPGELSNATQALARRLNITLHFVQPLTYPNTYDRRCAGGHPGLGARKAARQPALLHVARPPACLLATIHAPSRHSHCARPPCQAKPPHPPNQQPTQQPTTGAATG